MDALTNIDFETRQIKDKLTRLNIIRIGTSGSLQVDIPVDAFVLSTHGLDINGMLHSYNITDVSNPVIENAFIEQTHWHTNKARPIVINGSKLLENKLESSITHKGLTATAGGFYGPQGRVLRLELQDSGLNTKMDAFNFNGIKISNFEMETSAIYGLAKLMGHEALSLNAIIANRASGTFSKNPSKVIDDLIVYTLNKLVE